MDDPITVRLFCEERGHEVFTRALLSRLADVQGLQLDVQTSSATGGHGRAITELKAWQRFVSKVVVTGTPHVLVVIVDCKLHCDR